MADDEEANSAEFVRGETLDAHSARERSPALGIETLRQKAELEAALFGEPLAPIEIGHYAVIGTLGAGGMGVVYVAHDRRLDRRVALKLLRRADAGEVARARLQREAQAMARLSHPNVVTVHEVGTHKGQVFLAMEFVGGSNLRAWLNMAPRSWREIVAVFIQAGEGLAAAHDAGLIHRDFKPDNVLVGDDGRVRVADFGLAHGNKQDELDTLDSGVMSPAAVLDVPLTETGAIVGTPAYMAPEQHLGRRVDARSDQFSFCVALWEALYNQRPFPGRNVAELMASLVEERVDVPATSDVPLWLQQVLRRGISATPRRRWPSMRELLAALARDPERIRRRRLRVAAAAAVVVTIISILGVRTAIVSRRGARQLYWNVLTEELLEIERERGFLQATDDAQLARNAALLARNAARMSGYQRYRPREGLVDREDPTMAAVLLREVEGPGRATQEWISAANEILGQPISYAVLSGHRKAIMDLAFAPDASALYSAGEDNQVWRWDIATGVGRPIIRHAREVVTVAVSPDGRFVASGAKDHTARLWSPSEPDRAPVIAEHAGELTMVSFDPNSELLATASRDGEVHLIPLAGGPTRTLIAHDGPVYVLRFDADGRRLLTAGGDRLARLWRVSDGAALAGFSGHEAPIYHADFVDADRVLTGADDGDVRLWSIARQSGEVLKHHQAAITALDVAGGRVASAGLDSSLHVTTLADGREVQFGSSAAVWSLQLLAGGEQLLTGSFDGSPQLWSSRGGSPLRTFIGHSEAVLRVAVDPSGRWLATGSYDTDLRLWDLSRPSLRRSLVGHDQQVSAIAFDKDERRIATASHDGTVRLWSADDARELAVFSPGGESVYALAFSPDDALLAAGTRAGGVAVWDLGDASMRDFIGHEGDVWQLGFDGAGRRLVSASLDGTVRVWEVRDGRELLVLRGHEGAVTGAQFEPGDRRIVSAGDDGTVRIWDAGSGELLLTFDANAGKVWRLVRSPDGHTLATAHDDGSTWLWPDDDPSHSQVLRGHLQPVWSVAFDATGERVVTASFDNDARIWRASDGAMLRRLVGHAETVWGAAFTADGRVITASEDNSLRVWPRDTGSPVVLSGHSDAVTALAISRDGKRLLSGSADGSAKIWRLDRLQTDVEALHRRLRRETIWCLSAARRQRELGEDELDAERAFATCEASYGR